MITKKINKNYDNSKVIKPWGEEYNIYRNVKKIAITYLKIKKGQSTSLHCHPKKKTGFLILSGIAEVQIGIYKKNIFRYKSMSILVLRPGLFHKIKASNKQDLYALEIENPYIKTDLIRMEDNYGRKNSGYENLVQSVRLKKNDIVFKTPLIKKTNRYILNNVKIEIFYLKNFKKYNSYDDKSVSIILDGCLASSCGKIVISVGEIVKSYTLKKLSESFKVNSKILILKASKSLLKK
jgi:mannose-6-phosphate isomerase-like protein (cupin superfamily)